MKTIRWLLICLVATWLACSSANGQSGGYHSAFTPPPAPIPNDNADTHAAASYAPSGGFSDWIMNRRDCCEGRQGKSNPLFTELYVRAGASFPLGGQTLSRELQTGWSIVGGGRALFFNESLTKAWTIDPHIINTNESADNVGTKFPVTIFQGPIRSDFPAGVTIRASNRTMAGLGLGRELYLWQPADSAGRVCRVGWDFGGRYGSQRIDLNEAHRLTDTIGGIYAALHTDMDIPCRFGLWHTGLRLEWAYTWSDVLQRTSDVQDINLLWTVGLRF